jgi:hypothetical protein
MPVAKPKQTTTPPKKREVPTWAWIILYASLVLFLAWATYDPMEWQICYLNGCHRVR